ncbi:MAG: hypothetical protein ABL915_05165 [Gallionella sp.]
MFWLIGLGIAAWWIYRLRHGLASVAVADTTCDAESSSAHSMMQDESVRASLLDSMSDADTTEHDELNSCATNPANGLPMLGCVDIAGNFYGSDSSHHVFQDDSFLSSNMFDDTFSSSSFSSFDD